MAYSSFLYQKSSTLMPCTFTSLRTPVYSNSLQAIIAALELAAALEAGSCSATCHTLWQVLWFQDRYEVSTNISFRCSSPFVFFGIGCTAQLEVGYCQQQLFQDGILHVPAGSAAALTLRLVRPATPQSRNGLWFVKRLLRCAG